MATDSLLACITNPQTHTAIYCTHHPTQHTSRTPSPTRNSLDCDVFVATTLTSLRNQRKCVSSSKHAVIPIQLSTTAKHRAQSVHPQSAPLSSHNKLEGRIPLTLTFHPHNISVKNIILKNFKLLQHDPTTAEIFAQPLLISYKRDKNLSNFLVKSTLKSDHQPGTFKCARVRCRTCPFISNANKISGPKRTVAITDHFSCISTNLIYCITCTLCKKVYIGETGRRLGDRFREHLRDVEINDKDASKPVARHFNLPNHSQKHMAVCGLSLHLGNTESRKNIEQKFIFQIGTLSPCGINERFSFL